jgi:hypothetical protein
LVSFEVAASRKYLFEHEIDQSLQQLRASDQGSFSDESVSSGTEDLTVGEVIGAECSDKKVTMCNLLLHPVRLMLRVLYLRVGT